MLPAKTSFRFAHLWSSANAVYYESLGGFDICCIWVDGIFLLWKNKTLKCTLKQVTQRMLYSYISVVLSNYFLLRGIHPSAHTRTHSSWRFRSALKGGIPTRVFWSFHTTLTKREKQIKTIIKQLTSKTTSLTNHYHGLEFNNQTHQIVRTQYNNNILFDLSSIIVFV